MFSFQLLVESGTEAIAKLKELQEQDGRPVLVILDLHMPGGMDGDEAAEKIRKELTTCKRKYFLVCCSSEIVEDLKTRPWAGYFDYFAPKPLVSTSVEDMLEVFSAFVEKSEC